jgi:hypothetical protein
MPETVDLDLLPLARQGGQDQTTLPGLHVALPPRRAARGRQADKLILHLELAGNAPLEPDQHSQLLARLAQSYYKVPASVTAALRSVADELNQFLLDRNVHIASSGQQGIGILNMLVLREERLYLAQCGPAHFFLINHQEVQHIYDLQLAGRGLGLGRTLAIRYYQTNLSPTDMLLLAGQLPSGWIPAVMSEAYHQGPETLRRRLLSLAGPELGAVLGLVKSGSGKVQVLRPRLATAAALPETPPAAAEAAPETEQAPLTAAGQAPQPAVAVPLPSPDVEVPPEAAPKAAGPASVPPFVETPTIHAPQPLDEDALLSAAPDMRAASASAAPAAQAAPVAAPPAMDASAASLDIQVQAPVSPPAPARRRAARTGPSPLAGAGRGMRRLAGGLSSLLQRMLPGEGLFTLPSSVMIFVAVAVPVVVVAVASVVYIQRGRGAQFDLYYSQAVQAAETARQKTDPSARRTAWQVVTAYLDKAARYETGFQSDPQQLRQQAQAVFDELDGVKRLDFQPALSGALPDTFRTTRLAATDSDLYILDAAEGQVWRGVLTAQGYDFDSTFQCGPDFPNSGAIGPLIDIAALPKGNKANASLLAMDAAGNVLLCAPGTSPQFLVLAPPTTGWGQPAGFTLDQGDLYVLDPQTNAVWIYWQSQLDQPPQLFFAQQVPPMKDVIDLAVDKSDLYLLHADGHVTICTYSELNVAPTRCTDPVPFTDSRPGKVGQMLLPPDPFTQILSTQPPDPSLYLLEPKTQAIYHFSLRQLTFQRQFQSNGVLPPGASSVIPATAFTLSRDARIAFLALGNRIFYANIP